MHSLILGFLFFVYSCTGGGLKFDPYVISSANLHSSTQTSTLYDSGQGLMLTRASSDTVHTVTDFSTLGLSPTNTLGLTLGDWSPIEGGNLISGVVYDESSGLQFFLYGSARLDVTDTKKTITLLDDVTITYNSGTPAVITGPVSTVDYDETNGHIYWGGTGGYGIHVIDINGTFSDVSDDVEVGSYLKGGAFLSIDHLGKIAVDETNDIVYYSTGVRLGAIDRHGTATTADDTTLGHVDHATATKWTGGWVLFDFKLDPANNQIYTILHGPGGNFHSLNTQGTRSMADDTINYKFGSSDPSSYGAANFVLDEANGIIIVPFQGLNGWQGPNQIQIYDTNGTLAQGDDSIIKTYTAADFGPFPNQSFNIAYVESSKNLYLQSWNGLTTIQLNDLFNPADDQISSLPELLGGYSPLTARLAIDRQNERIYLPSLNGFTLYTPGKQFDSQAYISSPIAVQDLVSSLSWESSGTGQVEVRLRTGDASVNDIYEFDGTGTAGWGDWNSWGTPATTITNPSGIITLSNFTAGNSWSDTVFDTGKAANFYPVGSTVRARIRANCSQEVGVDMYEDDWWSTGKANLTNSDWTEIGFVSTSAFSMVGFEIYTLDGTTNISTACTSLDIDWIQIEPGDANWSAWSAPLTSGAVLSTDFTGASFMQYKVTLTSTTPGDSPVFESITVKHAYESSGSSIVDISFPSPQRPSRLEYQGEIPAGTAMSFDYSLDGGSTWNAITSNRFPSSAPKVSSLKVRANFTTANKKFSPVLKELKVYGL